ncbi:ATP-dependent Clp protease proteolytic subunit-related chloroplastic [Chlorella sorokiniana]|jgi:ATP-dependent Clp protease protease subunit|uniref:ATP-dependent Clp protease proteolytic subunit n=1 Tax=Chlorella sorokiniana TaxID=3076 RepID=A0A2P6TF49_CHLSO|nr:ATP-dependent Clp protease proteolytic subunit-related chloroplastic [Chlorella sorokiniana]|eukprot:PRW32599.1 ATP-dependent Clp protease proteolytic subunit-related chloroplastic [Chlorella sorokiniana]
MEAAACTSGRLGAGAALAHRCQRPSAQAALATARQLRRARRGAQAVVASMGLGFHVGQPAPSGLVAPQEPQLLLPEHDYGLSVKQMQVLGLGNDATGFGARLPEVKAEALRAKAFYVGDNVTETKRQVARMAVDTKAPGQAPPDLPSLLLDGRICYIGMALVPAVTELVISELLWLNYSAPDKPVYVYINSTGSQTMQGEAVGFETEATAIMDTMAYIRPDIYTLVIGQAFGNAAMILASGKKGYRYALPNSRIMTCPPRMNRSFGTTSNVMIKANELENATQTYVDFMSRFTGRDKEQVRKDVGRNRYFTPEQAVEYGIIDKVMQPSDAVAIERRDYEGMLRASQSQGRGARSGGAMAGADA